MLFLDELPEFNAPTLEALRQPLETGRAVVARANTHVTYPARFQLVAAMNPCRCGYLDDAGRACGRAPRCAADYQSRISGPLFDRIDLHVDVPACRPPTSRCRRRPRAAPRSPPASPRRARCSAALRRGAGTGARSRAPTPKPTASCWTRSPRPTPDGRALLTEAAERLRLSARGYHRVLRVARTLADLDGADNVRRTHVAEALSYRRIARAGEAAGTEFSVRSFASRGPLSRRAADVAQVFRRPRAARGRATDATSLGYEAGRSDSTKRAGGYLPRAHDRWLTDRDLFALPPSQAVAKS